MTLGRERKAAEVIAKAWLAHRDYQIYQILRAVVSVAEGDFGRILLSRLSPIEGQYIMSGCSIKLRLAGDSFPPKVVFKVSLNSQGAVCYLSGRRELKEDVQGALDMMGERNFNSQLTSDLLERRTNQLVVDEVDIGTAQDAARFRAYQEKSSATVGGKDNGWRLVDLKTLPRAAPFRDLFEVVDSNKLSLLPNSFWAKPRNREHLQAQIEILLQDEPRLATPPKPVSTAETERRRAESATNRVMKMTNLYLMGENEQESDHPDTSRPESNKLTIVDLDPMEVDNEARELYEWSQYL